MGNTLVDLQRRGDVFVLTMTAGENRWNTTLVQEINAALDVVEASTGPAALVTASNDPKFFSNGLDLEWMTARGDHPGGDPKVFATQAMTLFGRVITLPVPTVCAINGHAFGAGLMIALAHDVRVMRADRGYLCANELELGFAIPEPELALFRHKMPLHAFYQTVQLAKRWSSAEALAAGIVQQAVPLEAVVDTAVETAQSLTRLSRDRAVFGWMKEHIYGENAAINGVHGPAYMLRNSEKFASGPGSIPGAPPAN